MPKPTMRTLRFQGAEGSSGGAVAITFTAKPGKQFRIVSINASTVGGSGSTPVTVSGLIGDPETPSIPQVFDVDVQVAIIGTPNVSGLVSREGEDLVVTVEALASSIPKLNVAVIEESVNA